MNVIVIYYRFELTVISCLSVSIPVDRRKDERRVKADISLVRRIYTT